VWGGAAAPTGAEEAKAYLKNTSLCAARLKEQATMEKVMLTLFPSEDFTQWFDIAVLLGAHSNREAQFSIHNTCINCDGDEATFEASQRAFKQMSAIVSRAIFDFETFCDLLKHYTIITTEKEVYIANGDHCISLYGTRDGDMLIVEGACSRDGFDEERTFIDANKPRFTPFKYLRVTSNAFI
jgi:hypothetical protein